MSFDGTNSGSSQFGLMPTADGSFYETTCAGGTNLDSAGNPIGMVARLTVDSTATRVFAFNGTNGALPRGLLQASDGNFYGMTGLGGPGYSGSMYQGPAGQGTIFKMTPDGTLTTLVVFTNNEKPFGGLVQAKDGNLYGLTRCGGAYGYGTVFRLSVPMPPVLQPIGQPTNLTVCAGSPAIFTVAATGCGRMTYQWQVSQDGGNTFTNISNSCDQCELHEPGDPGADNGNEYQVIVVTATGGVDHFRAASLADINPDGRGGHGRQPDGLRGQQHSGVWAVRWAAAPRAASGRLRARAHSRRTRRRSTPPILRQPPILRRGRSR